MLACGAHVASENATAVALPVILPAPTATIAIAACREKTSCR